jgi:hypothetical protein
MPTRIATGEKFPILVLERTWEKASKAVWIIWSVTLKKSEQKLEQIYEDSSAWEDFEKVDMLARKVGVTCPAHPV